VNRQTLPAALGSIAARGGLAVGCGGAGSLAALALAQDVGAPAVAAGAVGVALAMSAVKSLAGVIDALANLLTGFIRARADAKATVISARVRADLARAGLDPEKTQQAAEMQRALSVNPDLPKDRRLADEALIKLHGASRARSSTSEPATGPDTPGNAPRNSKANKVVPIRSDP
jgi:hypothetical protein